jgi:hypothetical protein
MTMANLLEAYSRGQPIEVWDELSSVENIAHSDLLDEARAVAVTAMQRVRVNIERLIPRWENAGHVFGYHWFGNRINCRIRRLAGLTPLLGNPGDEDVEQLDRFEREGTIAHSPASIL